MSLTSVHFSAKGLGCLNQTAQNLHSCRAGGDKVAASLRRPRADSPAPNMAGPPRRRKSRERCNLRDPGPVGGTETMTASDPTLPSESRVAPLPQRILAATPQIRTFLRRLCGGSVARHHADVDDLLQDVMERALRYQHAFDSKLGSLENWLMKTAFRTYLNHRSKAQRRPQDLGPADAALIDPRPAPAAHRDEIDILLAQLSPIEQDILLRFHRVRESVAEIASALGIPPGTVKSHLHRARHKLARHKSARNRGDAT